MRAQSVWNNSSSSSSGGEEVGDHGGLEQQLVGGDHGGLDGEEVGGDQDHHGEEEDVGCGDVTPTATEERARATARAPRKSAAEA